MERALKILCLNAGSSSLKLALYDLAAGETRLLAAAVERIGAPQGRLWVRGDGDRMLVDAAGSFADARAAVAAALDALARVAREPLAAVGHRVVHGGPDHTGPERVDARLVATLRRLVPLAPLHLPAALDAIAAVATRFPDIPQVAAFDTAFHRRMPALAQRFPLPRRLWDHEIRRYGFHGLSYEYVVSAIGADRLGRAVIAHLGNGASLAAVRDGISVDTTMGLTPTGGVMMGTRAGDLDPGLLLYLMRERGLEVDDLERLVSHESGLLGVSGTTADMRTLLAARAHDARAADAVAMFCDRLRQAIGGLAAVLGGLDTLVFTGGIGEHAAPVRAETCAGLAHLGIRLDESRNAAGAEVVSADGAPCTVRVVATDEDLMIARHTRAVVAGAAPSSPAAPRA